MKIKRSNLIWSFIIVSVLLGFFCFQQGVRAEAEAIDNFNVKITIQKDGRIFVTENIIYNFGSNQKHGIFRDIPLTAVNGPQLKINVSGVTNEVGYPYQYTTSITNDILRIKIGDSDVLVSGVKTYVINYEVYNAIRVFDDHNELYWNVTGNQWPVTIKNVNASVVLPDSSISNIRMDCFTGPQGSTQKNCTFSQSDSIIYYSTTQSLNANEGLTLVLGIPLGYINNDYVSSQQTYSSSNTLNSNEIFFCYLLLFVLLVVDLGITIIILKASIGEIIGGSKKTSLKFIIPKELKGQPIVVEYYPPDNLPPIAIGTLLDRQVDPTDISSVIIDLAVRGYLKIRYLVQKIQFWPDKKDYELIKLKDGADLIHPADKIIFEFLFNNRDEVNLSDLQKPTTSFQSSIKKIQESVDNHLYDEGYFDKKAKEKSKKLKTCLDFALVMLTIEFFISIFFPTRFKSTFIVLFIVMSIVVSKIRTKLDRKLTPKGISTFKKILGFREFLQLTEKDKLELLNVPELQPEIFEKFLPYAMVLGVEDKWAQKFEGIYNTTPDWYEDPTIINFNSYVLTRNLIFFKDSFNQIFGIASLGSSSGFGGGGFSGGGSGGGGGGSW